MDSAEYSDSIRMDKTIPKVVELKKTRILFNIKIAPLYGWYMIFIFFLITQYIILSKNDTSNIFLDILAMTALVGHMYIFKNLLRRYLILEILHAKNEIQKLDEEDKNGKGKKV